jgi:DNA-binding NarL/FixJ family response regulator
MKILIVDDHALIRAALRSVLAELEPRASVIEAANGAQARRLADSEHPGLILLDLGLPDGDGMDLLVELHAASPDVPIVVLSAKQDGDTARGALDLGAVGFIPKSTPHAVMVSALQLVFAGGIYVPPETLDRRAAPAAAATKYPAPTVEQIMQADLGLTARQADVAALMMKGRSNKAICRELDLAEATVKNHVSAILRALNVANRTEAVIAIGALNTRAGRSQP